MLKLAFKFISGAYLSKQKQYWQHSVTTQVVMHLYEDEKYCSIPHHFINNISKFHAFMCENDSVNISERFSLLNEEIFIYLNMFIINLIEIMIHMLKDEKFFLIPISRTFNCIFKG